MSRTLSNTARVLIALSFVGIAACGSDSSNSSAQSGAVSVKDCGGTGATVSVDKTPSRIVALDSSSLEVLLSLGVSPDVIIGTSRPRPADGYPEALRSSVAKVKVLSKEYPSKEVLLAAEPDFVLASGTSAFTSASATGTKSELSSLGFGVYQLANDCGFPKPAVNLEPAWTDYTQLGELLAVKEPAQKLVDRQRAAVEKVTAAVKGTTPVRVFEVEAPEDAPYTMGAAGVPNALTTLAGGTNVFNDLDGAYDEVSWEAVAERNPQVIWLMPVAGSALGDDAAALEKFLKGKAGVKGTDAVRNDAFVTIPFEVGGFQSPRNDEALTALAEALHPDKFKN